MGSDRKHFTIVYESYISGYMYTIVEGARPGSLAAWRQVFPKLKFFLITLIRNGFFIRLSEEEPTNILKLFISLFIVRCTIVQVDRMIV